MAVLSRDELMERVRNVIGEEPDDNGVSLLEDITDTYEDMSTKSAGYDELKNKYDNLDKEWKQKYTARFYDGDGNVTQVIEEETVETVKEKETFEELFEEM